MNYNKINKILTIFEKQNPHPTTELQYTSNFELLISVMLSAKAKDMMVNNITKDLFKVANTPNKFLEIDCDKLKKYIKPIGLYNKKAINILKASEKIINDFNGKVPRNKADLESLPGVGRKTANVMLNVAFDYPNIAVDTHVFRVANRIGLANARTPIAVEQQLQKVIQKKHLKNVHHWLVLHGRKVCKARKPLCKECKISDLCSYKFKDLN